MHCIKEVCTQHDMGVPHEQAMLLRLAEPKGELHQGNGSLFLSPRWTFVPSARFERELGRLLGGYWCRHRPSFTIPAQRTIGLGPGCITLMAWS